MIIFDFEPYKSLIKEMVEKGFASRKISEDLKLPFKELNELIILNEFTLKKETFDISKIEHICSLYAEGISAKQLGFKYGISKLRVQKWVNDKGFLRTRSESHRFTALNEHIFDDIDTPAKAYWLGFFYADAYNSETTNTFKVCLKQEDHGHLVKLAEFVGLSADKVATDDVILDGIKYPSSLIRLYSKHICDTMKKHGCPQGKSFIIRYPEWLDKNLHSHFIRGMFDGDGCLTFRVKQKEWKWNLVSTKEGCESIKDILIKYADVSVQYGCISETNNNTYCMSTGGNEKIRRLMDWLHADSTDEIRLARKYKKYEQLALQQDSRQIGRKNYNIQNSEKQTILSEIGAGQSLDSIAALHNIHVNTVEKIKDSGKPGP